MTSNDVPLIDACIEGRVAVVEHAMQSGASPNTTYRGCAAIHWAVQYDQDAVVRLLLTCGAEPDRQDTDDSGFRPLHTAAGNGNASIVEQLLSAGADPNSTAEGNGDATPLHNAAAYGHFECVQLLVKHGAVVTHQDKEDRTPAHYARENGHEPIAEWLERQTRA